MIKLIKHKYYWNKFYNEVSNLEKPSNFSILIKKFLNKYNGIIIDVGCGNGRDLSYFVNNKFNMIGIDISKNAIEICKKKVSKKIHKNLFVKNFVKFDYKKIKKKISIYSRFTLHTISLKDEKIFLKKLEKIDNLDFLFIETRSTKDNLYGKGKKVGKNEYVTDHYRRFINKSELVNKLKKKFKILYIKESKGYSKFKNEDPCLIRIIAQKIK